MSIFQLDYSWNFRSLFDVTYIIYVTAECWYMLDFLFLFFFIPKKGDKHTKYLIDIRKIVWKISRDCFHNYSTSMRLLASSWSIWFESKFLTTPSVVIFKRISCYWSNFSSQRPFYVWRTMSKKSTSIIVFLFSVVLPWILFFPVVEILHYYYYQYFKCLFSN